MAKNLSQSLGAVPGAIVMNNPQMICSEMFNKMIFDINSQGIRFCCKSDSLTVEETELDQLGPKVFNHNHQLLARRHSMLESNQLPNPGCSLCANGDQHGFFKQRNSFNGLLAADNKQDLLARDHTTIFEIVLGNSCDMKCIYCDAKYSSSWAKERGVDLETTASSWKNKALRYFIQFLEDKYQNSSQQNLNIHLMGGEPTYMPEALRLVQDINARFPDLHKQYSMNTNGNTKPELFARWLEEVDRDTNIRWVFCFSLDSLRERCEAIRYGLVWDRVMQNMEELLRRPNTVVQLSPTVNLYSVPDLKEFIEFFYNKVRSYGKTFILTTNLVAERGMNVGHLPEWHKQDVQDAIDFIDSIPSEGTLEIPLFRNHLVRLRDMINTKTTPRDADAMLVYLNYFKAKRPDLDLLSVFPHAAVALDRCLGQQ